ncbi:MAG: hypothetical protein QM775_35525 [Pirellulales bacterium]
MNVGHTIADDKPDFVSTLSHRVGHVDDLRLAKRLHVQRVKAVDADPCRAKVGGKTKRRGLHARWEFKCSLREPAGAFRTGRTDPMRQRLHRLCDLSRCDIPDVQQKCSDQNSSNGHLGLSGRIRGELGIVSRRYADCRQMPS